MNNDYPTNKGIMTGRNGTYDIKAVNVCTIGDTLVRIDAKSKHKGIYLNGGLSMDNLTMTKIALDWLKHKGYLISWHQDDVYHYAHSEMCIAISPKEAQEILNNIERQFDATIGITWDTVETAIEDFIANR